MATYAGAGLVAGGGGRAVSAGGTGGRGRGGSAGGVDVELHAVNGGSGSGTAAGTTAGSTASSSLRTADLRSTFV